MFDGHAGAEAGIYVSENIIKILTSSKSWKEYAGLSSQKEKAQRVELLKTALVEAFLSLDDEYRGTDGVQYGIDEVKISSHYIQVCLYCFSNI